MNEDSKLKEIDSKLMKLEQLLHEIRKDITPDDKYLSFEKEIKKTVQTYATKIDQLETRIKTLEVRFAPKKESKKTEKKVPTKKERKIGLASRILRLFGIGD